MQASSTRIVNKSALHVMQSSSMQLLCLHHQEQPNLPSENLPKPTADVFELHIRVDVCAEPLPSAAHVKKKKKEPFFGMANAFRTGSPRWNVSPHLSISLSVWEKLAAVCPVKRLRRPPPPPRSCRSLPLFAPFSQPPVPSPIVW
ncbi:hypothetical protein FQA47_011427 [Oryzias melastigma]|uniref:Uncharacterized protein n=1 Tax=Oryzias melastigma TaxID=30732 RepID=A0A834FH35_ORYME|nr:hypothetical protein FQA47_011427 [Oryzias melastigma]